MKCQHCGGKTFSVRILKPYRFPDSGLSYLWINGLNIWRCQNCSKDTVPISQPENFFWTAARFVVQRPGRLTGEEVSYLREMLGLENAILALALGTTERVVANWQRTGTNRAGMSAMAERTLRLLVISQDPSFRCPIELLTDLSSKPRPVRHILLSPNRKIWWIREKP